jgi:hypothetical protein
MKTLIVLPVLVSLCFSGGYQLDAPAFCEGTDDGLQYDDGTAYWVAWAGDYRGVWFDVTDFYPETEGFTVLYTEFWFYHVAGAPWDTSNFYSELWNGDVVSGPTARLNQTLVTATHYSPVHVNYSPTIATEDDFWAIVNTTLSYNGSPTSPSDGSPNPTIHSFISDDFVLWEPYDVGGPTDYLIRISGAFSGALETETWGSIKGLYR